MVALSLITISLFALVSMQAHSMRSQTGSRETHQASVLAGSLLADAEEHLEANFEADPADVATRAMERLVAYPEFEGEVVIETPAIDLKKITVEVKWKNGPRTARRAVETIVAKPYY